MPTPRIRQPITPTYTIPELFELTTSCTKNYAKITMKLFTKEVTTTHIPHLPRLLRTYLPTILRSTCFNERNIPFSQEVTDTEIGHLFEHILLEYLCKEKINTGYTEAIFSGVTRWNWTKDTYGTFHIHVNVTWEERELLYFAMEQSIFLLKRILLLKQEEQAVVLSPFMFSQKALPMPALLKLITTKEQMA